MKSWIETYPHKVYASVLLLDGEIIDYKIGENHWATPFQVTLRGQISLKDLFESEVKNTYWEVNSDKEHNEVFDKLAKEWIYKQRTALTIE